MAESLFKRRIAAGLCGSCGKAPIVEGSKALCAVHLEESRQKAAAKRAAKKSLGECIETGCHVRTGLSPGGRCWQHLASNAADGKRRAQRKKEAGICVACPLSDPQPPKPGCVLCQYHIDELSKTASAHYARRKAAGLCRFGNHPPLPGESMCAYHRQQHQDYRTQLKMEVMEVYGGPRCSWPGCDNENLNELHLHHVAGGGEAHRREIGREGSYSFYLWLREHNYPPGYSVLCPTHHARADAELRQAKRTARQGVQQDE